MENGWDMQQALFLGPFMLPLAFSAKKQACGSEARTSRGKSIGIPHFGGGGLTS